jgi:hypothetical protein
MMGYKKKNRNVPVKREIFFPHTLNLLINLKNIQVTINLGEKYLFRIFSTLYSDMVACNSG